MHWKTERNMHALQRLDSCHTHAASIAPQRATPVMLHASIAIGAFIDGSMPAMLAGGQGCDA